MSARRASLLLYEQSSLEGLKETRCMTLTLLSEHVDSERRELQHCEERE